MKDLALGRWVLATGCGLALEALVLAAPAGAASQERTDDEEGRVRVTVRLWDRGDFDVAVLRATEAIVDHIFARAHVVVSWRHCIAGASEYGNQCMQPQGPNEVSVRVTRHHAAAGSLGEQVQGGCAVRSDRWPGSGFAYVYKDRIEEVSQLAEIPTAVVLGTIVTHEIGHLLLPRGHSTSGVMRGKVGIQEWIMAEQGSLLFTGQQSAALRLAPAPGDRAALEHPPNGGLSAWPGTRYSARSALFQALDPLATGW